MNARKSLLMLLLLVMMLLLMSGTNASADTGQIKLYPAGTQLTDNAYVVSVQDGRDTLELIETQAAETKTLWEAIEKKDLQIDRLIELTEDTNSKRLKAEVALLKEKRKRFGLGAFAGISCTGEPVIGIGVIWKIL